mgnify:CR=1 FL=1
MDAIIDEGTILPDAVDSIPNMFTEDGIYYLSVNGSNQFSSYVSTLEINVTKSGNFIYNFTVEIINGSCFTNEWCYIQINSKY